MVRGIDPARNPVTDVAAGAQASRAGTTGARWFWRGVGLRTGPFAGGAHGRPVTLVSPSGQVTPAGVVPRLKQMTVVGTFDSGHFEYDSALAMVHVEDAAKIFRLEGPSGVRLKLRDLHQARQVADELAVA
jgi:lipoprotein-releasing system permease protein